MGYDSSRLNQEGVSREGRRWGDVLGGDFVLSSPNPFFKKSDQIVMWPMSHG